MAVSKIEICNVALATLGADAIRSFSEKNKRARMADVFFDFTRDYLLAKFDWSFARKYVKLQPLSGVTSPEGLYAYQLPNDCHTARDIAPRGSKTKWIVMGNSLFCEIDSTSGVDVMLYYTYKIVDTSRFPSIFNDLLALGLAVKMGPAITQDKSLIAVLVEQFKIEQQNAWESSANVGNDYREFDEDPNNDSFVYPDGWIDPDVGWVR